MIYSDHFDLERLKITTISFNAYNQMEFYNQVIRNIVALANTKGGKLILGYSKDNPDENELMNRDINAVITTINKNVQRFIFIDDRYTDDNVWKGLAAELQKHINDYLAEYPDMDEIIDYAFEEILDSLNLRQDKYANSFKTIIEDFISKKNTRLEFSDIKNIITKITDKIKYQVSSEDLIESIKLDFIIDKPVLVLNIIKGDKPPYKTYKNIYKTKGDFYNLKDFHSVDNKKGQRKIYIRRLENYGYYTDSINRKEYNNKTKYALKYNRGYLGEEIGFRTYSDTHPIFCNSNYITEHFPDAKIIIDDKIHDKGNIKRVLLNKIKGHDESIKPDQYISNNQNIIVGGSIQLQALALYFYFKKFSEKFFNIESSNYKQLMTELVHSPIIHCDYSLKEPVKIIRRERILEIITPGGLHNKIDISKLQLITNPELTSRKYIEKTEEISLNKIPRNPNLKQYAREIKSDNNYSYDLTDIVIDFYNNNDYNRIYLADAINSFKILIFNNWRPELGNDKTMLRKIEILRVLKDRKDLYAKPDGLSKKELYKKLETIDKLDLDIEVDTLRRAYLKKMLGDENETGLISMTNPDNPTSKNQKYKITEKGIEKLKQYGI